jgi:hypothetical protein
MTQEQWKTLRQGVGITVGLALLLLGIAHIASTDKAFAASPYLTPRLIVVLFVACVAWAVIANFTETVRAAKPVIKFFGLLAFGFSAVWILVRMVRFMWYNSPS